MKKIYALIFVLVLFSGFALADLGEFPANFLTGGKFEGYIVSGKELGAIGIVSANTLQSAISSYIAPGRLGIVKLDSNIDIDNDMILVGNPCVNTLTSQLLDDPVPCDKDYPAGKAYIRYYQKGGYNYIVVAGNNAESTRKATQYLAGFASKTMEGDEVVIQTGESTASPDDKRSSPGMPPLDIVAPPPDGVGEGTESGDIVSENNCRR